jgi:NAD+ synthase (glutamine-hydrolysing)
MLGGQDELVFDGNSFVMDGRGAVVMRAPPFEEGLYRSSSNASDGVARPCPGHRARLADAESVYPRAGAGRARLRRQARFPGVVMGCRAASIRR